MSKLVVTQQRLCLPGVVWVSEEDWERWGSLFWKLVHSGTSTLFGLGLIMYGGSYLSWRR